MSFAIFLADGHHGPPIIATSPSGYNLLGECASVVRLAIQEYAQEQGITIILDGGDQNNFEPADKDFSDYRQSTQTLCNAFSGHYIVANGNHDFDKKTSDFHIQRPSELIKPDGFSNTSILVLQPKTALDKAEKRYFYYDEAELLDLLDDIETTNLIILAHWRLPINGSTITVPHKSSANLRGIFDQKTTHSLITLAQEKCRILGLHGHSHYFKSEQEPFQTLTMPSFVQAHLHETVPSALFTVLEETDQELRPHYKQIAFDPATFGKVSPPRYTVRDIDEKFMELYGQKPYIAPDTSRLIMP